jgi:hypothetical protein
VPRAIPHSRVKSVTHCRAAHTEPSQHLQEARRHLLLPGPLPHLRVDIRVGSKRLHLPVCLGLLSGTLSSTCVFHSSRLPVVTPPRYLEFFSSVPMGH